MINLTLFLFLVENSMERDKFMNPLEAKEFGIIDKVLEHPLQEREESNSSTDNPTSTNI